MIYATTLRFKSSCYCFASDEDGAVTTDWIVLTAGIMLMGVFAVQQIKPAQDALGEDIKNSLEAGVPTLPTPVFQ